LGLFKSDVSGNLPGNNLRIDRGLVDLADLGHYCEHFAQNFADLVGVYLRGLVLAYSPVSNPARKTGSVVNT
jgi:hypothetical protein